MQLDLRRVVDDSYDIAIGEGLFATMRYMLIMDWLKGTKGYKAGDTNGKGRVV